MATDLSIKIFLFIKEYVDNYLGSSCIIVSIQSHHLTEKKYSLNKYLIKEIFYRQYIDINIFKFEYILGWRLDIWMHRNMKG